VRVKPNRTPTRARRLHPSFKRQHVHADDIIETKHFSVKVRHLMNRSPEFTLSNTRNDPLSPLQIRRLNRNEHPLSLLTSPKPNLVPKP
jgi:hypothetical protein